MKRFTKIILIISGVCLVLGLACGLAATLIFGASLPHMILNNELIIYWDRTGLHSGKDDENTQYQESFSKSADAVDSLEIDVAAGEVYLRPVEAGSAINVAVTEGDASVLLAALSQDKRLKVAT